MTISLNTHYETASLTQICVQDILCDIRNAAQELSRHRIVRRLQVHMFCDEVRLKKSMFSRTVQRECIISTLHAFELQCDELDSPIFVILDDAQCHDQAGQIVEMFGETLMPDKSRIPIVRPFSLDEVESDDLTAIRLALNCNLESLVNISS